MLPFIRKLQKSYIKLKSVRTELTDASLQKRAKIIPWIESSLKLIQTWSSPSSVADVFALTQTGFRFAKLDTNIPKA